MKEMIIRISLLTLFFLPFRGSAQSLTGTWAGIMDDEWLEINIRQEGRKACGYTYDYIIGNKGNYCKAYFEGYYDSKMEYWVLNGTGFYENEGGHVLMSMKLWLDKSSRPYILRGNVGIKTVFSSLFGMGSSLPVALNRTSSTPKNIPGSNSPCFEPVSKSNREPVENRPSPPVTPKPAAPPKPKPVNPFKPPVAAPIDKTPEIRKDSVKPAKIDPPVSIIQQNEKVLSRKNKEMRRLTVNVDKINLKVYDNGVIDNDTVSIYYNGRLLVNRQKLSEKPINIDLTLDRSASEHTITMFAENLGSIPPNTALVVVTAGKKRYELFSSASLEENAVLIFDYNPDE